jgi:hypothetical protein
MGCWSPGDTVGKICVPAPPVSVRSGAVGLRPPFAGSVSTSPRHAAKRSASAGTSRRPACSHERRRSESVGDDVRRWERIEGGEVEASTPAHRPLGARGSTGYRVRVSKIHSSKRDESHPSSRTDKVEHAASAQRARGLLTTPEISDASPRNRPCPLPTASSRGCAARRGSTPLRRDSATSRRGGRAHDCAPPATWPRVAA